MERNGEETGSEERGEKNKQRDERGRRMGDGRRGQRQKGGEEKEEENGRKMRTPKGKGGKMTVNWSRWEDRIQFSYFCFKFWFVAKISQNII